MIIASLLVCLFRGLGPLVFALALTVCSPEGTNVDVSLMIRAVRLSHDLNRREGWEAFRSELREIVWPLIAKQEPQTSTGFGRAAAEG